MSAYISKTPRQEKREKDDAAVRKYCNGDRTAKEVAAMLGWSYNKTQLAVKRLRLKTKKDDRL